MAVTLLVVACHTFSRAGDHFKLSSITLWRILIDYRCSLAELTEKSDFNLITAIYLIGFKQHSGILRHLHLQTWVRELVNNQEPHTIYQVPKWLTFTSHYRRYKCELICTFNECESIGFYYFTIFSYLDCITLEFIEIVSLLQEKTSFIHSVLQTFGE